MNKLPWLSKDRLASQQASPSGSLPPRPISFVVHVLPPSKLMPSNIPEASPASACPTLVTITMLSGFAGLTATASSDSFRCRWLTSTLAGTLGDATTSAAAGTPASATAAATPAVTTASAMRYMPALPFASRVPGATTPLLHHGDQHHRDAAQPNPYPAV